MPAVLASADYLALVKEHPILPIRSEADLNRALARVDALLERPSLSAQEQGYLEVLSHEIERYEDEHYEIPDVSGVEMLKHLMTKREISQSGLAKDSQIAVSTLSEILSGKRELTLKHIGVLAEYFGVSPAVFLKG